MRFQLRQAAAEDADAVVRMHTLAHEECYGHLLPSEFFDARRAAIPERVAKRRPYLDSPDARIIALDSNNEIVGFADSLAGTRTRPRRLSCTPSTPSGAPTAAGSERLCCVPP